MFTVIIGWLRSRIRTVPVIISACALTAMLLIYAQITWWYQNFLITEKRSQVESILSPNGNNLNNALNRRFTLISALDAYIQSHLVDKRAFTSEQFVPFSRALYSSISGINQISAAPGGVITFEYPPNTAESSVGLDLIRHTNPLVDDSIIRSISTRNIIVVSPSKIENASLAFTGKKAVFNENNLWGIVIVKFDLIQILAESDMNLPHNGLTWALVDQYDNFIFGDAMIMEKQPVRYRIFLPEDEWYLTAAPQNGWKMAIQQDLNLFYYVGLTIIALLTILAYLLADQQTRLSEMVKARTSALQDELILREATEKRLLINEEKFHSVFNQMSDIAILYQLLSGGVPGFILEVNDAACKLLGFSRAEMQRLSLLDIEASENRPHFLQDISMSLPANLSFFETQFQKFDGEVLPVEIRHSRFTMMEKEVGLIIARDITERKMAEEDLQRSNRALKVLIEFNELLIRAASETELLKELCNILVNTGQYDLAWAGFVEGNNESLAAWVVEKSEYGLNLTIPDKSSISSLPILTDSSISLPLIIENQVIGALGIVISTSVSFSSEEINLLNKLADDISYGINTLRLRAEAAEKTEQLRRSESLYHELARNIPNGVVLLFDRKRAHILADGLGLAQFGLSPDSVPGKSLKDIFPADIHKVLNPQYEATLEGKTVTQEIRIHDRYYEIHSSPIRNDSGDVVMGLNLIQDISEHKNLQLTIKNQQEQVQKILDSIPAFIFFKSLDGKITWVNEAFLENAGLTKSEVINRYDHELFPFLEIEYLREGEAELVATGQPQRDIMGMSNIDGAGSRWFKTDKIPTFGEDGKPNGMIGFSFEITEIKKAEVEIQQLNVDLENRVALRTAELEEKNRELETFSYTVSHDLKAPLRGISGYSQLLQENHSQNLGGEGVQFLKNILDSVKHMDQLINDLLAYSRMERRALDNRELDVRQLVQSVLDEFRDEILLRNIQIKESYEFSTLISDGEGLTQILRNLIGNAVKFSGNQNCPSIQITGNETDKSWQISVSDNGIGFDKAHQERIFEIFQRLQSSAEYPGTGVGLAIVRKAISRLGGSIRVESEKGKGATFLVELLKGKNGSD